MRLKIAKALPVEDKLLEWHGQASVTMRGRPGAVSARSHDARGGDADVEWAASAATAYQQNHGQYTPVKDGDITWTGDPQQYANWYSGGKPFLNSDGTLVSNATDQQKYAYNQWLKDPAVAQSTYKIFQATNQGFLNGSTGGT